MSVVEVVLQQLVQTREYDTIDNFLRWLHSSSLKIRFWTPLVT
jgi:hypothetical protein